MRRHKPYEHKHEVQELEELATKLTLDLQAQLHLIRLTPVLSTEWRQMAELCGRIAHVADVESRLDSSGTIWEGDELALRFLMEDSKLNVCLRLLVEYREYSGEWEPILGKFEKGMTCLLIHAWRHVEALQTTDLPLLVAYIASELDQGRDSFVRCLSLHLEDLPVMALLRRHKIVDKLTVFLVKNNELTAAQALAAIIDTDDFATFEDDHVSPETVTQLPELKPWLDEYMDDLPTRKTIQPLLRFIQDCSYRRK